MTNNDLPVLDIATKMYKYENEFVEFENISKYNKYEIHKLNAAGEVQYVEHIHNGNTVLLSAIAADGDYAARAQIIFSHAVSTGSKAYVLEPIINVFIFIKPEHLNTAVVVEEDEIYEVKAVFEAAPSDPMDSSSAVILSPLLGFIVDVFITEPGKIKTKIIQYTKDYELYSIEYVMLALDSSNKIDEQYTFCEYGDIAYAEFPEIYLEDLQGKYIFRICEQDYLDELSAYLGMEYVAHRDLEDNQIADEDVQNHQKFKRLWFTKDQRQTFMQVYFNQGIGQTEIYNVPQQHHMQVLHVYLRLMHKLRQLFCFHSPATRYITVFEPISHESSKTIPLEPGQFKRHSSVCTHEGVCVFCECIVFGKDQMPLKRLSFEGPNEENLLHEEVFEYNQDGLILGSNRMW